MIRFCCALVMALAVLGAAEAPAGPPNMLIILADDLGYSDLGCYGGEIRTPNLDALGQRGLRFTQFYNTARCWPSRASILSGYYAQQVRRDALPGIKSGGAGVRPGWARLLPEMLKPLGYRSYHSGKWHIDGPRLKAGFDRSYSLEDHDRNFYPRNHFADDRKLPAADPGSGYYSTVAIADHAIQYLQEHAKEHAGKPFFQYLCFTVPHFPLHALPEDIERYRGRYTAGWDAIQKARWERLRKMKIADCPLPPLEPTVPAWNFTSERLENEIGPGEVAVARPWNSLSPAQKEFQSTKMAVHAAMVDRMDREVGRVLDQLKAMNAFENTIILFLSDNGASAEQIIRGDKHDTNAVPGSGGSYLCLGPGWSTAANTPFRLHKSWVHEGGICTPFIVHWPAGLKARGELRHSPAHLIDIAPTLLSLAGGTWPKEWNGNPVPPTPGKNLAPLFTKDAPIKREHLWWFHEGNRAIRVGDWKLVSAGKNGPWELYNLGRDRNELKDVAAAQPERVEELGRQWQRILNEFSDLARRDL